MERIVRLMRQKVTILLIMVLLMVNVFPASLKAAETSASFSIHFHDKNRDTYIYIASGGAVVVGITLAFFSGNYYSEKKINTGSMYASLLTFDMESRMYDFNIPQFSLGEESFYVPVFQLRF